MNPFPTNNNRSRGVGLPIPDPKAFEKTAHPLKRERTENLDALVGQVANMQFGSSPCFDDSPEKKVKGQKSVIEQLHKSIKNKVGDNLTTEEIESVAVAVIFAFTAKEVSPNKQQFYVEQKDEFVPFSILYNYKHRCAYVDIECHTADNENANVLIEIKMSKDENTHSSVSLVDATFDKIKKFLLYKKK